MLYNIQTLRHGAKGRRGLWMLIVGQRSQGAEIQIYNIDDYLL